MLKILLGLIFFALSFVSPALNNDVKAVTFNCQITLISPQTLDASQPLQMRANITNSDGDLNWKYVISVTGPGDYDQTYLFDANGVNGTVIDLGMLNTNGNYQITTVANNSTGPGDSDFDHITCDGSPLTFSVAGGAEPPPPPPPPPPPAPSDDPGCTIGFGSGTTGASATIEIGQSIEIVITGDGNPYFGGSWYIKEAHGAIPSTHGGKSYTFSPTSDSELGAHSFYGFHFPTGVFGSDHLCTGGGRSSVSVSVVEEGAGQSGTNPCGTECETAIGNFSTNPQDFVGQVLSIAVGLAGGIAFILMVIGAIRVLTSAGNPQSVNAGRDMIVAALAGLIFIIFSVLILKFIGVNIFGGLNPFAN